MGNVRIQHRKKWILICVLTVLLTGAFPMRLSAYSSDASEIIFLLDGSGSMVEERWQEAIDGMAMVAAMLPSDYQTAAIAYNQEIVISTDFGQALEEQLNELRKVKSEGYTNTGLALETALEMFSDGIAGEKRVIIISDGEISMRGQQETEDALALYDAAVQEALDKGVKIDLLLFEADKVEDQIGYGIEKTGGFAFHKATGENVGGFAEVYLFEQLGLERIMLASSDSSGNTADISLGDSCMEHARILITAENAIESIRAACQSRNVLVTQGKKFAVIDIEEPIEEKANLQYTLSGKGKINAYLVKEYNLSVNMEASYVEELSQHLIEVHITNADGKSILTEDSADEKAEIYINGKKACYTVERGMAVIPYSAEESCEVTVRVDFKKLNSIVFGNEEECSLYLELPLPPEEPQPEAEEEEKDSYIWVYAVAAGICVIFILLLILLLQTKKKTKKPQMGSKGKKALVRY